MFDHLTRDGAILFLIGITILTKVSPTLKMKRYSETAIKYSVCTGWALTVLGFITMMISAFAEST